MLTAVLRHARQYRKCQAADRTAHNVRGFFRNQITGHLNGQNKERAPTRSPNARVKGARPNRTVLRFTYFLKRKYCCEPVIGTVSLISVPFVTGCPLTGVHVVAGKTGLDTKV